MVIFLQRTFTSLVHAYAGRTRSHALDTGPCQRSWLRQNRCLPPVQVMPAVRFTQMLFRKYAELQDLRHSFVSQIRVVIIPAMDSSRPKEVVEKVCKMCKGILEKTNISFVVYRCERDNDSVYF